MPDKALLAFVGLTLIAPTIPLISSQSLTALSLARAAGLMALQLLWWQVVLGNRFITRYLTKDLVWVNRIHQLMGKYGFSLLVLHVVFIIQVYGVEYVWPNFDTQLNRAIFAGLLAFDITALLWLTSAVFRRKISWRWWKRLHFSAYAVLVLALGHSFYVGPDIANGFWRVWWFALAGTFLIEVLLRLVWASGLLKQQFEVVNVREVTHNVKRIDLRPRGKGFIPEKGQFLYLQLLRFGEEHPFTVSHFTHNSRMVSVTIKAIGPFSQEVHELEAGQAVFVDGPYGVFTARIKESDRPPVFIAGGIGITPFLRWIEDGAPDYLFYANRTKQDIVYLRDIANCPVNVTHVLSDQKMTTYPHGYVTIDMLKRDLDEPLKAYDFYICGPPIMMYMIEQKLRLQGVKSQHIFTERFSL